MVVIRMDTKTFRPSALQCVMDFSFFLIVGLLQGWNDIQRDPHAHTNCTLFISCSKQIYDLLLSPNNISALSQAPTLSLWKWMADVLTDAAQYNGFVAHP